VRRRYRQLVSDSPVVKLVNAVLLSALQQGSRTITIRRATAESCVVSLERDGVAHESMRPPIKLLAPMIRRLSIMARLPTYARGEVATGQIRLVIGDQRRADFAVRVEGHGDDRIAQLEVLAGDGVA
jgi:type II secretory ATPase GspE/PulE/Tfp pilus assembly ATPase PilB-like protein